jgi:hypothetical protein
MKCSMMESKRGVDGGGWRTLDLVGDTGDDGGCRHGCEKQGSEMHSVFVSAGLR